LELFNLVAEVLRKTFKDFVTPVRRWGVSHGSRP
jgi:hypothetical protein